MDSLTLTMRPLVKERKVVVEMDADRLERLAASLGFFSPEFLMSLDRAEADYQAGRVRSINSFQDLRK